MPKSMIFTLIGIYATMVAAGGVHIIKRAIRSDGQANSSKELSADLGFADLNGFFSNKGGSCVTGYFGDNIDFSNKGATIDSNSNKIEDTYFTSATEGEPPAESCLVINWERTNYSENNNTKWKGGFRWLWSFKKGDKGFVMFVTTKPSNEANTLSLDGGIYFAEKETTGTSWQIKKNKELTSSNKKITTSYLDNNFPKSGTEMQNIVELPSDNPVTDKNY